jgi:hypothetical protein
VPRLSQAAVQQADEIEHAVGYRHTRHDFSMSQKVNPLKAAMYD